MRIADSAIQLYSNNISLEQNQKRESLRVWQNGREQKSAEPVGGRGQELDPLKALENVIKDQVFLSSQKDVTHRQVQPSEVENSEEDAVNGDLNMMILRAFFEKITGRKFQEIIPSAVVAPANGQSAVPAANNSEAAGETPSAGYGLVYDYHESHYESEKTEFTAGGVINTADGQTINFTVGLSMSREFYTEQNINIRAGDALKDPLVINFSGTAAQLTTRNFSFDIDADGRTEQIAFVTPESGFLALDKNGDGRINNGSELFGALSGNGFEDLKAYDTDGNKWIDENDAVYQSLRIWSKDQAGNDQLVTLDKAGVGAVYLGSIETPFSIKDDQNQLLGQVRATGLAVMESGHLVTMQQIDLVA